MSPRRLEGLLYEGLAVSGIDDGWSILTRP